MQRSFLFACLLVLASPLIAQPGNGRNIRDGIEFSLSARTPEQTTAFYSARGFPPSAVEEIARTCFLTVGIYNRRADTVWLELDQWLIVDEHNRPVMRITRPEWAQRWQKLGTPLASQSTFGWTQLPEVRDLQPGEPVGGNVAVVPPAGVFTVIARFRTGQDKTGPKIEIIVPRVTCPGRGVQP